jgi:hypothetical protein
LKCKRPYEARRNPQWFLSGEITGLGGFRWIVEIPLMVAGTAIRREHGGGETV